MNTRIQIERRLIASVIKHNLYADVMNVISPKNFTALHIHIYEAVEALFPHTPIDELSVWRELEKRYSGEYLESLDTEYWVLFIGNDTIFSNATYWAFILLQLNIQEQFRFMILEWRSTREANFDHAKAGALLELQQVVESGTDLFEVIESAILYFEKHEMEPELSDTKDLDEKLAKKCKLIREFQGMKTALDYIFRQTKFAPEDIREPCITFAKAIAQMISTGNAHTKHLEAAEHLNTV